MARNTTTTNTTIETSTPRRKFGVNSSNIPTSAPTIVDGIYKGTLKNIKADAPDRQFAKFREIEDLQLFDVIEVVTGKKDARVHTGEYTITGAITYMVELSNVPGEQDLPMDTMTIMGGRVNIIFKKDEEGSWDLDSSVNDFGVVNRTWLAFQKATGLTNEDIDEIGEATLGIFDANEELPVPERLEHVPDVQDFLQACKFYKTFFSLVCENVTGKEVMVNVKRRARGDSDDLVNEINTGDWNSSCGLFAVEEA